MSAGAAAVVRPDGSLERPQGYRTWVHVEDGGPVSRTAPMQPATACAACHQSSAQDNFVFTQYYPVLRAAKSSGRAVPEDL